VTKEMLDPRAQELLADRALEGLSREEADELRRLGAEADPSFDLAAAGTQLSALPLEQMPAHVAQRVLAGMQASDAERQWREAASERNAKDGVRPIESARRRRSTVVAWLAAAACLLVAVGAWLWASQREPEVVHDVVHVMPATPSPADGRAELLATAKDVTTLAWTATADPNGKGAAGDVVWSASAQKGFMRFSGLAVNDPTQIQYQLWIFDKDRDEKYPVDGGVFDVTSTGEVIVAITAKLHVDQPTLFAVTIEKPGGVVVSKRERIVVTAAPKA
jgi:anti-sigma-K factor RskA